MSERYDNLDTLLNQRAGVLRAVPDDLPSPLPARSPQLRDSDIETVLDELRSRRTAQTVAVRVESLKPGVLDRSLRTLITDGLQRAARFVQNVGSADVGFAGNTTAQEGSHEDVVRAHSPCAITLTTREDSPRHVTLLGENEHGELEVLGGAITTRGLPARLELSPQSAGDYRFVLLTTPAALTSPLEAESSELRPCSVTELHVINEP